MAFAWKRNNFNILFTIYHNTNRFQLYCRQISLTYHLWLGAKNSPASNHETLFFSCIKSKHLWKVWISCTIWNSKNWDLFLYSLLKNKIFCYACEACTKQTLQIQTLIRSQRWMITHPHPRSFTLCEFSSFIYLYWSVEHTFVVRSFIVMCFGVIVRTTFCNLLSALDFFF